MSCPSSGVISFLVDIRERTKRREPLPRALLPPQTYSGPSLLLVLAPGLLHVRSGRGGYRLVYPWHPGPVVLRRWRAAASLYDALPLSTTLGIPSRVPL